MLVLAVTLAAAALTGTPANIVSKARGDGWTFTDRRGLTLYTFDRDEGAPGQSSCNAECAEAWPPLAAPADARATGDWSVIARGDNSLQWAFRGRPLYFFKGDPQPGTTFGDGVDNRWHLAFMPILTPREVAVGRTVLGQVLTDIRGHTLYSSKSECDKECLSTWEPVVAPVLAHGFGEWTLVTRSNGLRQWAYRGQALYRRPGADIAPGEVSGDGVAGWIVMLLEPAPPLPDWATVQASDAGELIANSAGFTVYTRAPNNNSRRFALAGIPGGANSAMAPCDSNACVEAQWQPLLAASGAKSAGSWAFIKLPDGTLQWSYKGRPLFINLLDKKPGDFKGIRFGARAGSRFTWAVIMRSGLPMQGVSAG